MSYQDRDNSGSLFKNDRKREGKTDPDYTGTATINGQSYFMDAWIKKPEGKKTFMSFSFKPKTGQRAAPADKSQLPTRPKPRPPGAPAPQRQTDPDWPDVEQ